MSRFAFTPHARFEGGELRCWDARVLEEAIEPYLSRRVLCATGKGLPGLLEDVEIAFRLPDGTRLPVRGRIIVVRDEATLIQVEPWSAEAWRAIEHAAGLGPQGPLTPAPVALASPAAFGGSAARSSQAEARLPSTIPTTPRAGTLTDAPDGPRPATMPSAGVEKEVASPRRGFAPVVEVVSAPPLAQDGDSSARAT